MDEAKAHHWHAIEIEEALRLLESSEDGLGEEEAGRRLERTGPNALAAEEGAGPLRMLLRQFHNPLIYLLGGAAALSLFVDHPVDAGVIAGVIVLNAILGFVQEWRAEGALAALRGMAAPHARVLRGGTPVTIDAAEVVPGDVLILETGDRVAADARLLGGEEMRVDESALTGESEPVAKEPGELDEDTPMADRRGMVWMSTNVTGGRGSAVVVETGMRTEMGRIAGDVRSVEREATPLQKRMHRLGIFLGIGGMGLAAVVFVLGLVRGYEAVEMLMFSVAVAVSAIPEGLPAVISVTLALGVRRMAGRGAIIRRMSAVETLGSTLVICTDKTGTLTRNQMTVRRIWAGGRIFETTGEGYDPAGEVRGEDGEPVGGSRGEGGGRPGRLPEALDRLLTIGVLCGNARLGREEKEWRVEGNPSEGALLAAAAKAGFDAERVRGEVARLAEIPFSSEAKYMATLHPDGGGEGRIAYVKGAPERVLNFCTHVLVDGRREELGGGLRERILAAGEEFASGAMRVIAGAFREMPGGSDSLERSDVEGGLTLAGLWGMIDPPREESRKAVEDAIRAGLRPVMITGDHATTAMAIARQVGIAGEGKEAVTGSEIDGMDGPALAKAALEIGVFARVTPAHKLRILQALKERGHIVAMTGDGVNDAPALKGADIGVAMGIAGTEVAKEAADMVLTDDNFATIVHAVEEGRGIYNNLRRVVYFLLATNLGEVITLAAALVVGMDLPLTAVMILWINLVTDGACTVPLGVEPRHGDVLARPPRAPGEFIIDRRMMIRMAALTPLMAAGTLLLFRYAQGRGDLAYARTWAFTAMAAFQWFQAFNARSDRQSVFSIGLFGNRWLLAGIGAAVVLQIFAIHTPVGRMLFGTMALSWIDWLLILAASSSIWIVDEILKATGAYGKLPA
ncbi:MAG: HAD-IC family P-type ATPase [Candidatus Krumholzibacteria bacterium]|nr:HAD-IC family P-type ATPase [Candidatus Krumholzibacteria bacterium]